MARNPNPDLLDRCCEDPWSLDLEERQEALLACRDEQLCWLPVLGRWVEPPGPSPDFPAFLLSLPRFAPLRTALQDAELAGHGPSHLPTGIRDELQCFADAYQDWLNVMEPEPLLRSDAERDRLVIQPR